MKFINIKIKNLLNFRFNKFGQKKIFIEDSKGFTLIELIIYMGLFSILTTITFQMFATIFDAQTEAEAVSSVTSDGKFIMNRFTYDLNHATSITSPVTLGTQSASLVMVVNSKSVSYSLNNNNLILANITSGTTDQLNSNETTVSGLSFIRLDGAGKDAVQITFTLTSAATKRAGKEVKTYTTSAGLR